QLDRFMIKTSIGYPDFESQVEILRDRQTAQPLDQVNKIITRDELLELQKEVTNIYVADPILRYITELTEATRQHPLIVQGVSPRGALALSKMAKAHAYLSNREYVIAEDVIAIYSDVCNHRLILNQKSKVTYDSSHDLLEAILKDIKLPEIETVSIK